MLDLLIVCVCCFVVEMKRSSVSKKSGLERTFFIISSISVVIGPVCVGCDFAIKFNRSMSDGAFTNTSMFGAGFP